MCKPNYMLPECQVMNEPCFGTVTCVDQSSGQQVMKPALYVSCS